MFFSRPVDLDANATTPVSRTVRRVMARVLKKYPGNPSSAYQNGRLARAMIEEARRQVANAMGAATSEITFTSGATEANNQVLRILLAQQGHSRRRLLVSPAEHPSVKTVAEMLSAQGVPVTWLRVDASGRVTPQALCEALTDDVFLVSCMLANNELGTINPVRELAALAHAAGALLHADCVQAAGKLPLDLGELGVDYATFSAHKLYGPKGVGVLYQRNGSTPLPPCLLGGGQENGQRAGTESVHNIAGCGRAFHDIPVLLKKMTHVAEQKNRLREGLKLLYPAMQENSPDVDVTANTLNVRFPGVHNAELLAWLDSRGVMVSGGSACSARGKKVSHVLSAIGLSPDAAQESVRFSLPVTIRKRHIDDVLRCMEKFFSGDVAAVQWVSAKEIDDNWLDSPDNLVLDVRLPPERVLMKGLPGALEIPMLGFGKHLHKVPADRNVLVVCTSGIDAMIVARALRARGHHHVGVLSGGVVAWRLHK